MESSSTVDRAECVTTFGLLRLDSKDFIKRTWPFDKSEVDNDYDDSVSSFPRNFVSLIPIPKKDNEPCECAPKPAVKPKVVVSSVYHPKISTGLQLIQSYSDSESTSPSPSPSPGKRIKLSNRTELPDTTSKFTSTNGSLFGTSSSSVASTPNVTFSKTCLEKRDKTSIKFTVTSSGKQNGSGFLPRSLQLNGKKTPFDDGPNKMLKTPMSTPEPSVSKLVNGKTNGVQQPSKFTFDRNEPIPSTSGLQLGNVTLGNGTVIRKDIVVNGFNNYNKQNGSPLQLQARILNGGVKIERKRVLSERGEAAAKFPVIDRRSLMMTWRECKFIKLGSRNCGAGLINTSNDCFLNAVLQTMLHTAPLARYVMELHNAAICALPNCFHCSLGTHMRHAINCCSPFRPNWIQSFLRKIFPAHLPGYQEDAHELLNLLLDALDEPVTSKHTGASSSIANSTLDTRPSTPIEQIFGGTLRNQIRCSECMEIFINYERIRELNLGLRLRKRDGPLDMDDLLSDYFATEPLGQYDCKKCKRKTQAQRSTRVLRAPNVLLVQLKRFTSFGTKIRVPVSLELNLRLDRFMYQPGESTSYQLNAVIEHMGNQIDHGHYIAAVRGFDGKTFHLFDDDESRPISTASLQQRQAYLMVYTKRDVRPIISNGASGKLREPRPKASSYEG